MTNTVKTPEWWEKTKLEELINIKHGFAFKWEYISDSDNWKVLLTPWNFLIWWWWKEWKKRYTWEIPSDYILKAWDLIVTMTDLSKDWDTLWYPALVPNDENRIFLHNQRIWYITIINEKIDKMFLYFLMRNREYQKFIVNFSSWSTVRHTSPDRIKAYEFFLPPKAEQKMIAKILSSFDDKIELLRAENETLEKIGEILFKEWFGKYKVGDDLPNGWKVGKITDIIKRESVPYKCDKNDLDPKWETPIIDQWITGLYWFTKREPDFFASRENPVIVFTNHTCNFWFVDYPFCAIQNVLPYRWVNWYDQWFLYFMTKWSISFIEYKWHWPNFVALDFIIPPVDLAKEFSAIVKPLLNKISYNKEEIISLSKTRDQLLPKLISWKIRVKF